MRDDVDVITPNPKTSGGARWNYLAAWAYADRKYNGDTQQTEDFVKKMYQNVLVLDSGARGATTTFVENGQGDVLVAWENEAYLSMRDNPEDYEIVNPSISILAQPSVAVVDDVVDDRGTRDVATEYLQYLYSDGDLYNFMDVNTYEQVALNQETIGDALKFVKENEMCKICSYNGKVFSVEPPLFVELEITDTEPGFKGDTATGATKPAVVETGATVYVPLFVNQGDKIKIDTRTGEYLSRV